MAKNWDKENMKSLAVNMKKETAEDFKKFAEKNSTTVGALLRGFVEATVGARTPADTEYAEGCPHTISYKNEDLLKDEVAHHNPDGLNPDEMVNWILTEYFRIAKRLRK